MKNCSSNYLSILLVCFILFLPKLLVANPNKNSVHNKNGSQKLTKLLNNIKFMNANFTQMVTNKSGYIVQEQAGNSTAYETQLIILAGTNPDHLLIVSDGHKIWHYDIDLEQVTVTDFSTEASSNKIANLLLSDKLSILDNFDVEVIDDLRFELNIKNNNNGHENAENADANNIDNLFVKAELVFNKSQQLIKICFYDQLNQETVIKFSKFKNKVDTNIFKFKIPEGIDVIENYGSKQE